MKASKTDNHWDSIDSAHCIALHHEFIRCDEAFKDFTNAASKMIFQAQHKLGSPDEHRSTSYKAYNAYSRFIHHLYEFLIGAAQREARSTKKIQASQAENIITWETQRILNSRRQAILEGRAPSWENDISYYPEKTPQEFARDFRRYRNKISGHVTYERSDLSLTEFYQKYHKFLHMLYYSCIGHWGLRDNKIPDLKEITDFSVLLSTEKVNPSETR